MFGRRARLPVDINAEANYDPDQKLREFANKDEPNEEQNDAKWWKMEGLVKSNIEAAQAKQKKYYDERSLVHHHASVLAAQYWKRISQERKEKVESWTTAGRVHTSSLQLLEKGFFNWRSYMETR